MLMRASLAGIVMATAAMGAFDGMAAWIILRFRRRRAKAPIRSLRPARGRCST